MELRRREVTRQRTEPKRGNFTGAVLISTLAVPFACSTSNAEPPPKIKCLSFDTIMAMISAKCQKAPNFETCMVENSLLGSELIVDVRSEKTTKEVKKGDVLFSKRVGEFLLVSEFRLKIRSVDRAGVEFELVEAPSVASDEELKRMGIEMKPEELKELKNRRQPHVVSIFRVSYGGKTSEGVKSLDMFGIGNLEVKPAGEGKAEVIYMVPKYCIKDQ